jgi:hypothetical protein
VYHQRASNGRGDMTEEEMGNDRRCGRHEKSRM